VSFPRRSRVPAEHGYEFRIAAGTAERRKAQKRLQLFDQCARRFGDQLPAGVLRFYMRTSAAIPVYRREPHRINSMGRRYARHRDAFDVKVRVVVDKRTRLSTFNWQSDMRYELSNALPRPVTVKLLQEGLWATRASRREPEEHAAQRRTRLNGP